MDKKMLNEFGWVVIVSIVAAVLLAFATPFGTYLGDAVINIAGGYYDAQDSATQQENVDKLSGELSDELNDGYDFSANSNDCTHPTVSVRGVISATCIKSGYTGDKYCTACKTVIEYGEKTDVSNTHGTLQTVGVVTGNCSQSSYTGDKKCTVCDKIVEKGRYIPGTGHLNTSVVGYLDATCTKNGYSGDLVCNSCGKTVETGDTILATGHKNISKTGYIEPTCSSEGNTGYQVCGVCNTVIENGSTIPVIEHNWVVINTVNVCTGNGGYESRMCTMCRTTKDVEIAPIGHNVTLASTDEIATGNYNLCLNCNKYVVPEDCIYVSNVKNLFLNNYYEVYIPQNNIIVAGDTFPETPSDFDMFVNQDYVYIYNPVADDIYGCDIYVNNVQQVSSMKTVPSGYYTEEFGWKVKVRDTTKESYIDMASAINGKKVDNLEQAFSYCDNLLKAPKISKNAIELTMTFSYCYNIVDASSIVINENSKYMYGMFMECYLLEKAPVVTDVADDAIMTCVFEFCATLNDISSFSIPQGVIAIENMFFGCSSLTDANNLVIPSSVQYMTSLFEECISLTTAPDFKNATGVKFAENAFGGCASLKYSDIPPNLLNAHFMFADCTSLESVGELPSSLQVVNYMFARCVNLTGNIKVDCTLAEGYEGAFYETVKPIYLTGSAPVSTMQNLALTGNNQNVSYDGMIPYGGEYFVYSSNTYRYGGESFPEASYNDTYVYGDYLYQYLQAHSYDSGVMAYSVDGWNCKDTLLDKQQYGEVLSYINEKPVLFMHSTFKGNTVIKIAPEIPNTVVCMAGTFYGCSSLVNAPTKIPASVVCFGETFRDCILLEETPVFEEGVKNFGYAFYNCYSLTNVHPLPSTTDKLASTFTSCSSLLSVDTSKIKNCTNMQSAFYYCSLLSETPHIPDGVTNMNWIFYYCTSLTDFSSVHVDNTVTTMKSAFCGCQAVEDMSNVIIPDSVDNMDYTFNDCTSLTGNITINASPTTYTGCFKNTVKPIYLVGDSNKLTELAATDGYADFSESDNVRVGEAYYRGVTSNVVCDFTGATEIYTNPDNYPDVPQSGDVLLTIDYEYRYNQEQEWVYGLNLHL